MMQDAAAPQDAAAQDAAAQQDAAAPQDAAPQDAAAPQQDALAQDAAPQQDAALQDAAAPQDAPQQDAAAPQDAAQQKQLISNMEWANDIQADPDVGFGPLTHAAQQDAAAPQDAVTQDAAAPQDAAEQQDAATQDAAEQQDAATQDAAAPQDAAQLISDMEWANYIQADPDVPFGSPSAVSTSIFTVPKFLKHTKKEAYEPQRVSLGPYHHGRAELREMGNHKGRALRTTMTRCSMRNINVDFANYAVDEILLRENEIRYTYEKSFDCDAKSLARMLCLDGCFLLQVLRSLGVKGLTGDVAWEWYSPLNREKKIMFAAFDTVKDILMLENQVPFIVLRNLLKLELNETDDRVDDMLFNETDDRVDDMLLSLLLKTTRGLFKHFDDRIFSKMEWLEWLDLSVPATQNLPPVQQLHHLLGFLYRVIVSPPILYRRHRLDGGECSIYIKGCYRQCIKCCSPCFMKLQDRFKKAQNDVQRIRPAVELSNAGIKFKPCYGGIEAIDFHKGSATIFLPPIRITDITEVLFRNLMAFEMRQPLEINFVSCYVNLMDNLIDSEKDVALLIRMGVLGNWVGRDKEVVDLFKGLKKAAPVNLLDAFHQLTKRVNDHYENQIRVQLQYPELVRDYFSPRWRAVASGAAIFLLFNALVQTIFTIISTFK